MTTNSSINEVVAEVKELRNNYNQLDTKERQSKIGRAFYNAITARIQWIKKQDSTPFKKQDSTPFKKRFEQRRRNVGNYKKAIDEAD